MSRSASHEGVFQAIASPTRRALLDALTRGESNVSDLIASVHLTQSPETAMTQSAVSQQLTILKSAGLVAERSEGRFRYYTLCLEPLAEVDTWLTRYRALMEQQLDALARVLDAMPDEPALHPGPKSRPTKPSRSR